MPRRHTRETAPNTRESPLIDAAEKAAFGAQEKPTPSPAPNATERLKKIQIAGYRILDEIHAGGQGVVFRALQETTGRNVAIKFLRSGPLASVDDQDRFDRETRVLGQLRHPNIVAVHDSGESGGHRYLVMDLVDGVSVDRYVDGGGLTLHDTLLMFQTLCGAIHAAHLRGVIHRDLKPSNILVNENGNPCILDFGLAKLTMELSETMVSPHITVTGQFLGTLPWASPEQVDGAPDQVDIRTDIYSLGVLLFRLLTGVPPYEVQGRIRDVLSNITTVPPTRPRTIRPDIDEDLETIILKCLNKDPRDRYQSVAAMVDDLQRYSANQPILARPPSTTYHLKKFVVRHKTTSALAGLTLMCFLAFGLVMTVLYRSAEVARRGEFVQRVSAEDNLARALQAEGDARVAAATASQVSGFLVELFGTAAPDNAKGGTITVRDVLDRGATRVQLELADQPKVQATLLMTMGSAYRSLALHDEAQKLLDQSLRLRRAALGDQHPDVATSLIELAGAHRDQGDYKTTEAYYKEALGIQQRVLGDDSVAVAQTLNNWSVILCKQGRFAAAEPLTKKSLAIRRAQLGDAHPDVAQSLNGLCMILQKLGQYAEAEPFCREALVSRRNTFGENHTSVAACLLNLARVLEQNGALDEAEPLYREALEINKHLLGAEHPRVGLSVENFGSFYYRRRAYETAEKMYRASLNISLNAYGEDHPETAYTLGNLASALLQQGEMDEAETLYRKALEIRRRKLAPESPLLTRPLLGLGKISLKKAKPADAEPLLREALAVSTAGYPKGHRMIAVCQSVLGECLTARGVFEEAEDLLLRGYQGLAGTKGEPHQTLAARRRIMALYAAWGQPERAGTWEEALQTP